MESELWLEEESFCFLENLKRETEEKEMIESDCWELFIIYNY